jgi:hypothetical protein
MNQMNTEQPNKEMNTEQPNKEMNAEQPTKETTGVGGFFRAQIDKMKAKMAAAKAAIEDDMKMVNNISTGQKVAAIIVAVCFGLAGLTGLGSLVAGRKKAGTAMLGIPFVLWMLTFGCMFAWICSAIASIVVIGIPFFIIFSGLLVILTPLACSSWYVFYVSDIIMCVKAK